MTYNSWRYKEAIYFVPSGKCSVTIRFKWKHEVDRRADIHTTVDIRPNQACLVTQGFRNRSVDYTTRLVSAEWEPAGNGWGFGKIRYGGRFGDYAVIE